MSASDKPSEKPFDRPGDTTRAPSWAFDLDAGVCRALGRQLDEIGLAPLAYALSSSVAEVPESEREARRRGFLDEHRGPASDAIRMLMHDQPIAREAAEGALGARVLTELCARGVVVEREGGLVSTLLLNLFDTTWVFVDHLNAPDAVMGSSLMTTFLGRAALPRKPVGAVLDLGCGAGTIALALASRCDRVVASDLNPRAIAMTRLNARINGIENVEPRVGDMFSSVTGESFDLVVSQPPFIAQPDDAESITWLYGGRRGDEFPLRFLAGVYAHLAPRGMAIALIEWPEGEGDRETAERVRAVVTADDASVLVLQAPPIDLDAYCAAWARMDHPHGGTDFERARDTKRRHFDTLGVRTLRQSLTVVARGEGPAWTVTQAVRPFPDCTISHTRIERLVSAQRCLASRARLVEARLRIAKGVVFSGNPARVVFPENVPFAPVVLAKNVLDAASLVSECDSVREAQDLYVEQFPESRRDGARALLLERIEQALASGVLEPIA